MIFIFINKIVKSIPSLTNISVSNITYTSFKLNVKLNKDGKIYYLITADSTQPLVGDLISSTYKDVTADTSIDINFNGLEPVTKYYIFLMAADSSNNNSDIATKTVTTAIKSLLVKLNDTGVILHRNITSGEEKAGEYTWLPKQDAALGRDVTYNNNDDGHAGFSFTVLNNSGAELTGKTSAHEPNTTDLCVRDNVTGLVWEVKKSDGDDNVSKTFRDKNGGYTWYSEDDTTNGGEVGGKDSNNKCVDATNTIGGDNNKICNSASYVVAVNNASLCGKTGWRLPTRAELMSIVNNSRISPLVDINYFPNTLTGGWTLTSQTSPATKTAVWVVDFYTGMGYGANINADGGTKNGVALKGGWENTVRLVSGTPVPSMQINKIPSSTPNSRYTVNSSNETVIDKYTGLMWKMCTEGLSGSDCNTGTATIKESWWYVLSGDDGYPDFAGKSNWRVPNARELGSLVEAASIQGINTTIFPNTLTDNVFASSTPFPKGINISSNLNAFFAIHFGSGSHVKTFEKSNGISSNGSYVRLVRNIK